MKKIFLLLIAILCFGISGLYAQTCTSEKGYNDFPFTANGITVDKELTGNFTTYSSAYTACGINEKAYSIWTGQSGPATFQTNFSIALNDIMYNLAGTNTTEAFTVTVSNGTPSIVMVAGDCSGAWTISGNVLTCSNDALASGNAGARIKIHSTQPYTWIKFSHNGGAGGTIFTMCFDAAYESVQPTVSTTSVSSVTGSSAASGGNISVDGGSAVTARGVCWNTSGTPTISDSHTSDGTGIGTFSSSLTSLAAGTTYYLRAYATNANGTAYGAQVSFTTSSTPPPSDPTSISASVNPICNGASTQLTANGAVGTVYWYTGSCGGTQVGTGNSITVNPSTTTVYYARNYNNSLFSTGCANITVTAYASLTANISGGTSPLCYNTAPGTLTATGNGGTGSYTYLWYKNGVSTGVTTQTYAPGNLASTSTFYCAVTSGSCGTVNTSTTTITVYGDLSASISGGTSPLCYNTAPGTFTATGNGGTGSYTYLWYKNGISTGVTTQTYAPGNLASTSTFYCAVTSGSCGTVNTSTTTITVYGNLSAAISGGTTPVCYNTAPGTLTVTGNGGNGTYTYLWYKNGVSTGVTTQTYAPGNLAATSTFYCAVTSGSCGTVNTSTSTITVYNDLSAGISGGASPVCYNSAPGSLTATGNGGTGSYTYLWYKNGVSTGVTTQTYAPGNLASTSTFYCAVTSGSCGTVNTSTTTITVYGDLSASISGGTSPLCYNTAPGTFTATGNGGTGSYTYLWYKNGISTGVTTQTYAPGNLASTSTFYCAVTSGSCGTVNTSTTTITVYSNLSAAISGGTTPVCYNTAPEALTATGNGGNGTYSYLWFKNGESTGVTTQTYEPGNLTSTATYYCAVTSGSCGTVNTSTSTITVYNDLSASLSGGSSPICYNTLTGTFTATAHGGNGSYTYLWFKDGEATGVTTQAYTPAALTKGADFYCEVSSGTCGTVTTSTASIIVYSDFVKGSISTEGEIICYNGDAGIIGNVTAASGGDENITYQWQSSSDALFTSPVVLSESNTSTFNPAAGLKATTWYRRLAKDGNCTAFIASDGVWKVTVRDQFVAPVVSSNQTICWNTTAGQLTATEVSGGTGPYTYQWQMSSNGETWSDIADATTLTFLPGNLFETTYYRLLATDNGTPSCETLKASNAITITVRDPYTPSVISMAGNSTICNNTAPGLLTATPTLGGSGPTYTYQWQMKTTGNWINVGSNSLTYQPANLKTNTLFRLIAFDNGTPACGSVFSLNNILVTVQSAPVAGLIGSDQTICADTKPATLTSIINGSTSTPGAALSYKWEYSNNLGESWTVIESAKGSEYSPEALTQSTLFRRTVISTLNGISCESEPVQVVITVDALPLAVAGGTQDVCSSATAIINGASFANGDILWTEDGNGSITSGETTLTPVYTPAADDAGKTVTLTMTVSSNNVCAPKSATAFYTLHIDELPAAAAGGSATICSNGSITVDGVSASNGEITWTENGAGSITSGENTLTPTYAASADDAGKTVTLTMTVSSVNACSPEKATAEFTVHVDPLPTAVAGGSTTVCSDGTIAVTGASASNGTILWTADGAGILTSETTTEPSYTPAEGDAGKTVVLTMTVTSDNSCGPQVATATYTIHVRPVFVAPMVSPDQQICYSSSAAPLQATPASGGSGGYVYQWQYSENGTSEWTNIEGAASLSYSPGALMATTDFRILATDIGTPACGEAVASKVITVIVNDPLYPPVVASGAEQATVCYKGTIELYTASEATGGTGPFTYQWQKSANGFNHWENIGPNSIDNTTYQVEDLTTNTFFRVIAKDAGSPSCGSTFSNVVSVTVQAVPVAGSIAADQQICSGSVPAALTSIAEGTGSGIISYRWEQSTDGLDWTSIENSEASLTVGELTQTTWFRRITLSTLNGSVCESEPAAPVKIKVLKPAATAGADKEICVGASTVIGGEAVAGSTYSWSSVPGDFVSTEANPTVTPEITTTYTVVETFTETGCTATNSVIVIVDAIPVPVITGDALIAEGTEGSVYKTDEGFADYKWTVSEGGQIVAGEGTSAITVNWIDLGQHTVSVQYTNAGGCGPAEATVYNVTVAPVPDAAVVTQHDNVLTSSAPEGNQWYRDGVAIEGATGSEFTMDEPGSYYVIVTLNGISSAPSNTVIITVSVDDLEVSHSFDVYPNPSQGRFDIKVSSARPVELNIVIYNSIGVQVWKKENVSVNGTFVAPVELNSVPNGVYTVSLSNSKIAMARKIVVMK